MKIKKICIVLIKIALIIFLVVTFNLIMMPKYIEENQDGRVIAEMYREKVSPDVVFLGSSTVYSGVTPCGLYEGYGITSYVCASSSQTSWDSLCVLKETLKHMDPKLVVFDIGFLHIGDEYAEEVSNRKLFDYMHNDLIKYHGVNEAMAHEVESGYSYLFPVLRYHTRYKDLTYNDFKYAFYKPDVTFNGYIMSVLQSSELPEARSLDEAPDMILSDRNRKCLQEVIDICKARNIQVLLMKTPSYQAKWGPVYEGQIAEVASINGISYINFDFYSDAMGIDYYSDSPDNGGHLNLFGAEKFSYYLGNILMTYYNLPDRRNDSVYNAIWADKVNRYECEKINKIQEMY